MERTFEHILRRALILDESEKRHRAKIRLGASKHDGIALRRQQCIVVVAANETEVGEHARLPVVGEVVRAAEEVVE